VAGISPAAIDLTGRDLFGAASILVLILAGAIALTVMRGGWSALRQHVRRIALLAVIGVAAVSLGILSHKTIGSSEFGSAIVTALAVLAAAGFFVFRLCARSGEGASDAQRQVARALGQPVSWWLFGGIMVALVALAIIESILFPE
jgi:hypothetical protein